MNEERRELVERVFIILDRNNTGIVDFQEMKRAYNAKRHPDVMQGKKSAEAALMEFSDTFDLHHALYANGNSWGKGGVSLAEFMDYYACVGACIESDEHFQIIMNNAWNLSGAGLTFQNFDSS